LAVDRGPLAAGPPPMVQPARWIIRPCPQTTTLYSLYDAVRVANLTVGLVVVIVERTSIYTENTRGIEWHITRVNQSKLRE